MAVKKEQKKNCGLKKCMFKIHYGLKVQSFFMTTTAGQFLYSTSEIKRFLNKIL